jgi:cbb3-type cytochrome oxidase subunit 3
MNLNYKILSRLFLHKVLLIIIIILSLIVVYQLYNTNSKIENFDETMIKNDYPDLLVDTGYNPSLYTYNQLPSNAFDKYSIKKIKRDLKEFTDILYLGNPL